MRRRPWLASLGLSAAILLAGSAAYGDPNTGSTSNAADSTGSGAPPAAPDSGVRPQGGAATPPTGTGTGTGDYNVPVGSGAAQILAQTQRVQTDGEQRKQTQQSITTDQALITSRQSAVKLAQADVDALQDKVNSQASKAYKDQAKVPDKFNPYSSEFNQLNDLEPWLDKGDGYNQGQQDGKDYLAALNLLEQAQAELKSAQDQLATDQALLKQLTTQQQQDAKTLATMRTQNAQAVAQLSALEAAYNAQFAGQIGTAVNGLVAAKQAQQAVRYAISQVGKPYQWGAEGPNAYDCSGLVMAAYQSAGIQLPRVADDQYMATAGQSVPISALLPGDLLFYGTDPGVPTSIYHVAMYVGNGNMVQAPDYGIPVQVVPVGFGQLYGATRVVGATPKKTTSKPPTKTHPTKPASPSPSPKPTGSGSGSGSPSSPPSSPPSSSSPPVTTTTRPSTAPPAQPPSTSSSGSGSGSSSPSTSPSGSEPASTSASSSASDSTSSSPS